MKRLKYRFNYSIILLNQLVKTDFKLRYQGSVLGYLWSLLRPLALFSIMYVVFVEFLRFGDAVPHYASYLLVGIILWNFFSEITSGSVGSIVARGDLLRKISFPRYVIILSVSISALINLFFNLGVVTVFMIIQDVDISPWIFLAPLLLVELYVFSLGVAFFLSAVYVKFRDLNYIWEVILQAGFYATPIFYPLSMVVEQSPRLSKILMLNPVAQIIQDFRYIAISPVTVTSSSLFNTGLYRLIPIAIVLVVFIGGVLYFKKRSPYFAEEI